MKRIRLTESQFNMLVSKCVNEALENNIRVDYTAEADSQWQGGVSFPTHLYLVNTGLCGYSDLEQDVNNIGEVGELTISSIIGNDAEYVGDYGALGFSIDEIHQLLDNGKLSNYEGGPYIQSYFISKEDAMRYSSLIKQCKR